MRTLITASVIVGLCTFAACSSDATTEPTTSTSDVATTTTAATTDTGGTSPDTTSPENPLAATTTTKATTTVASTVPPITQPLAANMVVIGPFVSGLNKPVDIATRADDPTLFVVQQDGKIIPIRNGALGSAVLDIGTQISTGNEQGLLGMAFHPTEPFAYVDYTNPIGDSIIAEYRVKADGTFDAATARVVLAVKQPFPNHNGGKVAFGPDGMLYIGFGDGGAGDDPNRNGLSLSTMLAKMLRINPLRSGDKPYSVPPDNPYVDLEGAFPEIWASGLRNPWRFDFDSVTGDLWIADVGQNQWEEVNVARAADGGGKAANFGWSAWEGSHRYNADQPAGDPQPPIWEYQHGDDGCSVSGGAVYRGSDIPSLVGWYIVADYCSGKVWALQPGKGNTLAGAPLQIGVVPNPSAVVDTPDGAMYVLGVSDGTIRRISRP